MTTKFVRTFIVLCVGASMAAPWPAVGQDADEADVNVQNDAVDLEPYQVEVGASLVDLDMIPVPPGSINMAVEDESGPVDVGPFWMSRTEIPWDLFDVYAFGSDQPEETEDGDAILQPSRPYGAPDRGFGHRGYAAISMTYLVAEEFAEWLSTITGDTYRLPTDAEWEYACRAGRAPDLPDEELEDVAWYWDNAFDETHPIGELAPNGFGLYDMIGNAAEWCVGMDGEPLACGGSYMDRADDVGCSARKVPSPKWQETDPQIPKSRFWLTDGPFMGFRVIRVP